MFAEVLDFQVEFGDLLLQTHVQLLLPREDVQHLLLQRFLLHQQFLPDGQVLAVGGDVQEGGSLGAVEGVRVLGEVLEQIRPDRNGLLLEGDGCGLLEVVGEEGAVGAALVGPGQEEEEGLVHLEGEGELPHDLQHAVQKLDEDGRVLLGVVVLVVVLA